MTTSLVANLFNHSFTANDNLFKVQIIKGESEDSLLNSLSFRIKNFPSVNLTPKYVSISYRNITISQPAPVVNDTKRISGLQILVDDKLDLYEELKKYLLHDDQLYSRLLTYDDVLEDIDNTKSLDINGQYLLDNYSFDLRLVAYAPSIDTKSSELIEVYEWVFRNCFLLKLSPISFSYSNPEAATISVDLIYNYIEEQLLSTTEVSEVETTIDDINMNLASSRNSILEITEKLQDAAEDTRLGRLISYAEEQPLLTTEVSEVETTIDDINMNLASSRNSILETTEKLLQDAAEDTRIGRLISYVEEQLLSTTEVSEVETTIDDINMKLANSRNSVLETTEKLLQDAAKDTRTRRLISYAEEQPLLTTEVSEVETTIDDINMKLASSRNSVLETTEKLQDAAKDTRTRRLISYVEEQLLSTTEVSEVETTIDDINMNLATSRNSVLETTEKLLQDAAKDTRLGRLISYVEENENLIDESQERIDDIYTDTRAVIADYRDSEAQNQLEYEQQSFQNSNDYMQYQQAIDNREELETAANNNDYAEDHSDNDLANEISNYRYLANLNFTSRQRDIDYTYQQNNIELEKYKQRVDQTVNTSIQEIESLQQDIAQARNNIDYAFDMF